MKTINYFVIAAFAAALFACNEPSAEDSVESVVEREVADWKPSDSSLDSVCYYLGVNFASQLKGQLFEDMGEFNMEAFKRGMEESFKAGLPKEKDDSVWAAAFSINPWEMTSKMPEYFAQRMSYKAKYNEKLGERFLADNEGRDSVEVAESGLQYIIHTEGEGGKVGARDTVVMNYRGTLIDGAVFDYGDSTEFVTNDLVKGWSEGLSLLGKGGKATLFIPEKLAYGTKPPRGGNIPPSATLIIEVEVVDVKEKE